MVMDKERIKPGHWLVVRDSSLVFALMVGRQEGHTVPRGSHPEQMQEQEVLRGKLTELKFYIPLHTQ